MRRMRRTYDRPFKRWDALRIKDEKRLISTYGLKNKREIWKAKSMVRSLRQMARKLFTSDEGKEELFRKIKRFGFIRGEFGLDDVLGLTVDSVLERRLQTLVYRKGLAKTPGQARQLIVHGHIFVGDRAVTVPSYLVTVEEENKIKYNPNSAVADKNHPIRAVEKPAEKTKGKEEVKEDGREKA